MKNNFNPVIAILKKQKGYARTNVILSKGIHTRTIKKALEEGKIVKVKNGLYKLPDIDVSSNMSFIDIKLSVPKGVICLLSALSYYELTTFIPSVVSVAVPRNSWRPKIEYPPVAFYCFSSKQYEAGIEKINIGGHEISIYSIEKTICDCFKYRNKLGIDISKEALSGYLKLKNRNLEKLMEYAKICSVKQVLETWLSAMV